MTVGDNNYNERLAAEAARVRGSGVLGRSDPLIRLFDYLLQQALDGHVPREIEIAQEVFDKRSDFDVMLDASVRVYIHRLRRKLGEFYANSPGGGDQLALPLGEYRLVLSAGPQAEEVVEEVTEVVQPPAAKGWRLRWINRFTLTVAGILFLNLLGWIVYSARPPVDQGPVLNKLWRPILDSRRPTQIVLGDYYIYGESNDGVGVSRLVRDFSVNSRADLDAYLMLNPDRVGQSFDVDLHYLPVSAGIAMRDVLPTVNAAASGSFGRPPIEALSQSKPEILKVANIVYIGFLSGLGDLQAPLFRASGFKIGEDFDELVDKTTGKVFRSDWSQVAAGKSQQRDYGYIASMIGPTGNRIVVLAGTRDPAVLQMAEIASDSAQLDQLDEKVGDGPFEALFEVRTQGNLNIGSTLLVARPIRSKGIW